MGDDKHHKILSKYQLQEHSENKFNKNYDVCIVTIRFEDSNMVYIKGVIK